MSKPLDYLRSSPVRGQLEPYDSKTPMGWRYIQTTDTLNELKVLLPPGTAAMYEQLLKLENYELSKKSISWDRILEIRHLKDRMTRKCQRLAKTAAPSFKSLSPFQTFIAPEDFRVKEMEKWFRDQQKRASIGTVRPAPAPIAQAPIVATPAHNHAHTQCVHCISGQSPSRALPQAVKSTAIPAVSFKSNFQRSVTNAPAPVAPLKPSSKPGMYARTHALINVSRAIKPERTSSLPVNQTRALSSTRLSVISPPPLPVLLRGQRSQFGLDDELGQPESAQGEPVPSESESEVSQTPSQPVPGDDPETSKVALQEVKSSPQSSSDEVSPTTGDIHQKRSCIKRGSMSELGAKTVSWADDQGLDGQMSRYASAARDAQASGRKWEEIRAIYSEQINGLEHLQLQVREGLESLKVQSEHLHRVDDTIRRQQEQLRQTFDELERTNSLFNTKVKEALEQADDTMSRHGLHKTSHLLTHE